MTKKKSCMKCCKTFKHKQSLYRHHQSNCGKKKVTCSKCNQKFSRKDTLEIHLKGCKGIKKTNELDCDVWGKHFSYNWFVQRHKKQVHFKETVDFICSKCKKTYKKKTPTGHTY